MEPSLVSPSTSGTTSTFRTDRIRSQTPILFDAAAEDLGRIPRQATASASLIKSVSSVLRASIKSVSGVALASMKKINGLTNV